MDAGGFCLLARCVRVCVRVCVCACVRACVCVNANAPQKHPSLLLLFVTVIYMDDPRAGECLNVYSVIV